MLLQNMSDINWNAALVPLLIFFAFIMLGIYSVWIKYKFKDTLTQEDIAEIKETQAAIINAIPDNLEPVAEGARNLGEFIGRQIIEKGPGLGASLAFRHPELQKIVAIVVDIIVNAILCYFNEHHEEVLDTIQQQYSQAQEKNTQNIRALKIKLKGGGT